MPSLKIISYDKNLPKIFKKEKKKIFSVIGDNDIQHIGSTAVPGLGGKGIVDIMIGIKNWNQAESIRQKLKEIGFKHVHPREKGRIFLSKHRQATPDNVHLHLVIKNSKKYKELLAFRDYLKKNKKETNRYFQFKQEWLKRTKGDRSKYNKLKEKYIKEVLNFK